MQRLVLLVLKIYRSCISPVLPPACIYSPSCSEYARLAIKDLGVFKGILAASWRLLRCNPWGKGGYDPPPDKRRK